MIVELDQTPQTTQRRMRPVFRNMSPLDYRYYEEDVADYLSEDAFTAYELKFEVALVQTLNEYGICPDDVVPEIEAACAQVTTDEVYDEEEGVTKHDVRALVNCIRRKVSDKAKPYVHMVATSFDTRDTATGARFKEVTENVSVPELLKLESTLIMLVLRESETTQVGRTHGQHAVPVTVGFWLAPFISRIGKCIEELRELAKQQIGKSSGATGSYNSSSLFVKDPEKFEMDVLAKVDLKPADISTQVVQPEPLTRLLTEYVILAGSIANLADDIRNLQRTEIAEVGDRKGKNEVSSSTMPNKGNPIIPEGVKSHWKIVMPRINTVYMDQISEHQRDLTTSASGRTSVEIVAYTVSMTRKANSALGRLVINHENIARNLGMTQGRILAEPLYLLLSAYGHPDGHKKSQALSQQAEAEGKSFSEVIKADEEIRPYLEKMTAHQLQVLEDPLHYVGIAAQKARGVAEIWKERLNL